MDLTKIINKERFAGVMTVSDIHGEWKSAQAVFDYAEARNLFLVFLGDLMDGGNHPELVVDKVLFDGLCTGNAAFIIGNHDYKYYRHAIGNKVIFSKEQKNTVAKGGVKWNERIVRLCDHKASDFISTYGSWVFTHGAVHRTFWDNEEGAELSKHQRDRALYGEVDGSREPLTLKEWTINSYRYVRKMITGEDYAPMIGFPVRTYRWTDDIPAGKNVVVGHDRRPLDKPKFDAKPVVYTNANGSAAYFTDTGSGKDPEIGGVTGAVFSFTEDDLVFEEFRFFKN